MSGPIEVVARFGLQRPKTSIAIWLSIGLLSLPGLAQLRIETSTDSVLDRTSSDWSYYQQSVDKFGSDEIVVIARGLASPIDSESALPLKGIAVDLARNPSVRRVDGVSTLPSPGLDESGQLALSSALERAEASGAPLGRMVRADRVLSSGIVSDDLLTDSLVVRMEDIGAEHDNTIADAVRGIGDDENTWLSGGPIFRVATNELTQAELTVLGPVTATVIALLIWAFFGSVRAVAAAFVVGLLTACSTLSIMGTLGVPISITTYILPTVLIALAASYSIHVVNGLWMDDNSDGLRVARAVALSGATTAIGFVAMGFARIAVIRDVGVFGAIGAIIGMLCAVTLAPAIVGTGASNRFAKLAGSALPRIAEFCVRRRTFVLGLWLGLFVILGTGIFRLEVETDVVLYFPVGSEVRDDYDEIRRRLAGISPLSIVVDRGGESVTSPEVLALVDQFQAAMEADPVVGVTVSIADPIRQVHGAMTGDPTQPLPGSQAEIDQYLLLLEGIDHLEDVISRDRASTQVMIRADNNGSDDLLALAARAESWWATHATDTDITAQATGIMHEYARSERAIEDGQIAGLLFAGTAIFLVLWVVFGGPRLAAISMVPNATPIFAAFGAMGLVGIPLDAGTILVGTLALGIAVDDTIHVISAYRDPECKGLVTEAISRVGNAIVCTTVAVAFGFAVLATSGFALVGNLGLVTVFVMLMCLAADTTLLPALIGRSRR